MSESTSPAGTRPSSEFLLDTNILIAAIGRDANVLDAIARSAAAYIPAVALGELYYGASHSAYPDQNVDVVRNLAAGRPVLHTDAATALRYGYVKAELRRRGRLIPDNDLWIAALALPHGLVLATRDAHFSAVTGLRTVRWDGTDVPV